MRIFESRTIISTVYALPAPTHLPELGHYLFFINVRQRLRKAIRGSLEFRKGSCLRPVLASGNINPERLPTARDGNRTIRFQETGNSLAELAYADFCRGHGHAPYPYASVHLCVRVCKRMSKDTTPHLRGKTEPVKSIPKAETFVHNFITSD